MMDCLREVLLLQGVKVSWIFILILLDGGRLLDRSQLYPPFGPLLESRNGCGHPLGTGYGSGSRTVGFQWT
jgi:hypothetical protein